MSSSPRFLLGSLAALFTFLVSFSPVVAQTPPPPPIGVSSSGQNLAVNLAWSSANGATSYNIQRSAWNGGPYTTIATGVTNPNFQDSGLLNGTTYYYTVTSTGSGGESGPSMQTFAAPQAVTSLPARPFLHPLFADHVVLQRDALAPVWGWTAPGTTVSVTINGQTKTTTTTVTGRWQVDVGPFAAGGPYTMSVTAQQQTVTVSDILFGDVFIFSGQSNMERQLGQRPPQPDIYNYANEIAAANYPNIRQFSIPLSSANREAQTITGSWYVCNPSNVVNFSAVGYLVSRNLFKNTGVPIGILHSAYGGTAIDTWLEPVEAAKFPEFSDTINTLPASTGPGTSVTAVYNNMLAPLAPYRIKGAFWYQGESSSDQPEQYQSRLPALMKGWRRIFGQPNLPFVIFQLPGYASAATTPVETGSWAELREAQKNSVDGDPYSRLAIAIDVGNADIHPPDKQDVSYRGSLAARDVMYGQTIVSQGPLFTGAIVEGGTIRCSFSNLGAGLMVGAKTQPPNSGPVTADVAGGTQPATQVVGGTLTGFAIAGANKSFVAATASISGNTVVVSAASVTAPLYVRYGWANMPACNLYNKITDGNGNVIDGLPASPFRNDPVSRLTVVNGSGSNIYAFGSQVGITASNLGGATFFSWFGDSSYLANAKSQTTTATLSRPYVSVGGAYSLTQSPSNLAATASSLSINLTWSALNNAISYNIKRSSSASGPFTPIASGILGTSYSDTSTGFGGTYFYRISGSNRVGAGPDTTSTVSATAQPPVAPAGFTAAAGNGLISLSWSAVSGATGYTLSRSTVSGGPYTTLIAQAPGTSYVDTNLTNGTTYFYTVAALSNTTTGPSAKQVSATPGTAISTASVLRSVNGISSASDINAGETDVQGFDQNTATKWLTHSSTGWLQYQFVVTFAWPISEYRITSANDVPNRHPKNWTFLGSNDGSTWITLDTQTNQSYGSQYQVQTYTIPPGNVATYRYYRLNVTANNGDTSLQLAELALYAKPSDTTLLRRSINGISSASAVSSGQTDVQGFDQNNGSKWLPASPTGWLQYQFGSDSAWTISQYQITSANDVPSRHPKNWDFQGSNDGSLWTTLDSQTNQTYGSQYLVRTYSIPTGNIASYRFYRLNVTANNGDSYLQLAELALFSPPTDTGDKTAPVFAATPNLSLTTTDASGRAVAFSIVANDAVSGSISATCTPASGTVFPVGVTTVACSATDLAGNTATTSFTVRVINSTVPVSTAAPAFSFDGTTGQIAVATVAGHVYQLQRTYDLTANTWENLGAPNEGGGILQVTDTPSSTEKKAFYRFKIDP